MFAPAVAVVIVGVFIISLKWLLSMYIASIIIHFV